MRKDWAALGKVFLSPGKGSGKHTAGSSWWSCALTLWVGTLDAGSDARAPVL